MVSRQQTSIRSPLDSTGQTPLSAITHIASPLSTIAYPQFQSQDGINTNATHIDATARNLYSRPARKGHMNAEHIAHCALCGASSADTDLLGGRSGYVCLGCLGPAFSAIAKTRSRPRGTSDVEHQLDAAYRCFICDKRISTARLVAYRHPFCFCGDCLQTTFEICITDNSEPLSIVRF